MHGLTQFDYTGFGCYCGVGGNGYPIDETDACCQFHDTCWTKAEEKYGQSGSGQM